MASITKRTSKAGTVTFLAQVRVKGQPTLTATFTSRRDAKQWAGDKEADLRAGRTVAVQTSKRVTLHDAIQRYLKEVLPHKKSGRSQIQQLDWWSSRLGTLDLRDVTPAHVAEAKSALAVGMTPRGTIRTPASVNRYLAVLSHLFNVAMLEWNLVDDNPCGKVKKLKEPKGRVRFLSDEERRLILDNVRKSKSRHLYPLVMLALCTGMRQGEVRWLTWDRVDFERSRVLLEDTKNDERRSVPLPPAAFKALQDWKAIAPETALLFPSTNDPHEPVEVARTWARMMKRIGIKDFHFHDLRHTTASYLAMSGATTQEIAEILGHKTLAVVKRYAHLTESHTAEVVNRMARAFDLDGESDKKS
jgi:integrase